MFGKRKLEMINEKGREVNCKIFSYMESYKFKEKMIEYFELIFHDLLTSLIFIFLLVLQESNKQATQHLQNGMWYLSITSKASKLLLCFI